MRVALLALAACVAHVFAGSDFMPKQCRKLALALSETFAGHHCRNLIAPTTSLQHEEIDMNIEDMIDMTGCAYGDYDFVHGGIPRPESLRPTTTMRMMIACLLQQSSVNFLHETVYKGDVKSPKNCVDEVLDNNIYNPLNYSREVVELIDVEAMLKMSYRPPCLEMVMSAFAREYVDKVQLKDPPEHPGVLQQWKGVRLMSERFDLEEEPAGVEWATLWIKLKTWKEGELKGWTLAYRDNPKRFPVCTVWYYKRGGKP